MLVLCNNTAASQRLTLSLCERFIIGGSSGSDFTFVYTDVWQVHRNLYSFFSYDLHMILSHTAISSPPLSLSLP
jgi:hypothetical protein